MIEYDDSGGCLLHNSIHHCLNRAGPGGGQDEGDDCYRRDLIVLLVTGTFIDDGDNFRLLSGNDNHTTKADNHAYNFDSDHGLAEDAGSDD